MDYKKKKKKKSRPPKGNDISTSWSSYLRSQRSAPEPALPARPCLPSTTSTLSLLPALLRAHSKSPAQVAQGDVTREVTLKAIPKKAKGNEIVCSEMRVLRAPDHPSIVRPVSFTLSPTPHVVVSLSPTCFLFRRSNFTSGSSRRQNTTSLSTRCQRTL